MEYRSLGRSGVKVSPLCLGTMAFGQLATEEESFAIMDRALEEGINFFDTANIYGGKGKTESIIGRWLAQGGARRERIVLATKANGPMGDGPNDRRLSARHIRQACDDSLRRLQTDYIDLYQMHRIDRETPWEEIWQAMDLLIQQGKIIYVGSSNFASWNLMEGQKVAEQRNLLGIVSEQCRYSLLQRGCEVELLPCARSLQVGVIPYSPVGSGLLCGGNDSPAEKARRLAPRVWRHKEKLEDKIHRWEVFCAERGQPPAEMALAWVMANPAVTAPIIGPRTIGHLEGSLRALDIRLTVDDLAVMDEIFPGPGGEAPEAWAW